MLRDTLASMSGRSGLHEERATGSYWVVIPAYNEAKTVRDVVVRARRQCPNVIVVDDGSTDGTAEALAGLDVTLLCNEQNCGKAGSLVRGFDYALTHGAAGVITLDADGQHKPEEIPVFLERAKDCPTTLLVGARRRDQRRALFWRYAANRAADFWISWAAGQPIEDSQSGYRLYPACLLRDVTIPSSAERSFVYESEILIEAVRHGYEIRSVSVSVTCRPGPSPSHFRPVLDIARIVCMVAWKLLSRGMYPQGLWTWLTSSHMRYTASSLTKGE